MSVNQFENLGKGGRFQVNGNIGALILVFTLDLMFGAPIIVVCRLKTGVTARHFKN